MRGKKAKQLRRLAEDVTVGKPARQLVEQPNNPSTAVNNPGTTRAVYRVMKQNYRKLNRNEK